MIAWKQPQKYLREWEWCGPIKSYESRQQAGLACGPQLASPCLRQCSGPGRKPLGSVTACPRVWAVQSIGPPTSLTKLQRNQELAPGWKPTTALSRFLRSWRVCLFLEASLTQWKKYCMGRLVRAPSLSQTRSKRQTPALSCTALPFTRKRWPHYLRSPEPRMKALPFSPSPSSPRTYPSLA